jgi:hypothetical protein
VCATAAAMKLKRTVVADAETVVQNETGCTRHRSGTVNVTDLRRQYTAPTHKL